MNRFSLSFILLFCSLATSHVLFSAEAVDISPYLKRLADNDPDNRLQGALALRRVGPAAKGAIPALANALHDTEKAVSTAAAETLGKIGPEAVPALIEVLKDPRRNVRVLGALALSRIGPAAKDAVPALIECLHDDSEKVISSAINTLCLIGKPAAPALPALMALLKGPRPTLRTITADALPLFREDAMPLLSQALDDQVAEVRSAAAVGLGKIGAEASPALPALIKHLEDPVSSVRADCARAIGYIGAVPKEALIALDKLLSDPGTEVRDASAAALGAIGKPAESILAAHMKDQNVDSRLRVAQALSNFSPAMDLILDALKDSSPEIRRRATELLGKSGDAGHSLSPLIAALNDESQAVRASAADALGKFNADGAPALQPLAKCLTDGSEFVRQKASESIFSISPDAQIIPALIAAMQANSAETKSSVSKALGRAGPAAASAVPVLCTALLDEDPHLRECAAAALGLIGPGAKESVPALIPLLSELDNTVLSSATEALGKIGPDAKNAVPALIATLKHKRYEVRSKAAESLGKINGGAEAVQPLAALLKDEYLVVRLKAIEALAAIGAPASTVLLDSMKDGRVAIRKIALNAFAKMPEDPSTLPALELALADDDLSMRLAGVDMLGSLGERAVPELKKALKQYDYRIRAETLNAMAKMVPIPPVVLPDFIDAMKDDAMQVRAASYLALDKAGPVAVPLLLAALKHKHPEIRNGAIKVLSAKALDPEIAVPAFMPLLSDEHTEISQSALKVLSELGRTAPKKTMLFFKEALANDDANTRMHAADILAAMGSDAVPAVPTLALTLKDENARVRKAATQAIGKIGPAAAEVAPTLIAMLRDAPNAAERDSILSTLEALGPAAEPDVAIALTDGTAIVRWECASLLSKIAKPEQAVPALMDVLGNSRWEAREGAALALGHLGASAKAAESKVSEALKDKQAEVSWAAAWALTNINPENAAAAVPVLATGLKTDYLEGRVKWAEGLAKLGAVAKDAAPALIEACKDNSAIVQTAVAHALGKIGAEAFPAVVKGAKDERVAVRKGAVVALGQLSSIVPGALDALAEAARQGDVETRRLAALTLRNLLATPVPAHETEKTAMAVSAAPTSKTTETTTSSPPVKANPGIYTKLLPALNDVDLEVRRDVLSIFGAAGPAVSEFYPALVTAVKDLNENIRGNALDYLKKDSATAIPYLIDAMKDPKPENRQAVLQALSKLQSVEKFVPALLIALGSEKWEMRESAALALSALPTGAAVEAIPALNARLADDNAQVALAAASAIAAIAPADAGRKTALPVLLRALKQESLQSRMTAVQGLHKLGAEGKDALPALLELLKDANAALRAEVKLTLDAVAGGDKDRLATVAIAVNEAAALEVCNLYLQAQDIYYLHDGSGDGIPQYAQSLLGQGGLLTPAVQKRRMQSGGFPEYQVLMSAGSAKHPYRFKVLSAQGDKAQGGARPYILNGKMVGGHALIAAPVVYNGSGRRTFMTNATGAIYAKDLGAETAQYFDRTADFNPDDTWTKLTAAVIEVKKADGKKKVQQDADF